MVLRQEGRKIKEGGDQGGTHRGIKTAKITVSPEDAAGLWVTSRRLNTDLYLVKLCAGWARNISKGQMENMRSDGKMEASPRAAGESKIAEWSTVEGCRMG